MSEGNFDALLSSVLGNEELMGKISSIMSSHNGNQDESLPEVINAVSSTLGIKSDDMTKKQDEAIPISNVKGIPDFSRNTRLLSALRPYLSEKRAQMVDSILKLEQLAEIMKLTR